MKIQKYKLFWLFSDVFVIIISSIITFIISGNLHFLKSNKVIIEFIVTSLLWIAIIVLLFDYHNLYKNNIFLTKSIQIVSIIKSLISSSIILLFLSFVLNIELIIDSKYFYLILTLMSLFNFVFIRALLVRKIYLLLFNYNIIKHNIIILGAGKTAKLFATKVLFECPLKIKIIGFFDDNIEKDTPIVAGIKCLGKINDLKYYLILSKVDEIIIAIDDLDYSQLFELIDKINNYNIPIRITSEHFDIIPKKIKVEEFSSIPLVDIYPRINPILNYIVKRFIDITLSLIALILLSPLFIVVSILIKINSKGPVIYRQKRIGKNGKEFTFYKFRTMTIAQDDPERKIKMIQFIKSGKNIIPQKIINESRVTKIGKFLRKYSIDEFPQLINVLLGNMSLVGPRPCLPYEYENYNDWQKKRVKVLPGCTGVWQVWGRSNVNFNDSVIMDLYYVNNFNPWLDIQIILKTIPVLLFGKGGK